MDADRAVLPDPKLDPKAAQRRGIRNNNPGNIRPGQHFIGEVGEDEGYSVFDTAPNGICAIAKDLKTKYTHDGLCTIKAIITKWAPPKDNNNTGAYIANVCKDTGFDADAWLHLLDLWVMASMVKAIIHQENGYVPYTDDVIDAACARALA